MNRKYVCQSVRATAGGGMQHRLVIVVSDNEIASDDDSFANLGFTPFTPQPQWPELPQISSWTVQLNDDGSLSLRLWNAEFLRIEPPHVPADWLSSVLAQGFVTCIVVSETAAENAAGAHIPVSPH